MIEVDGLTHRYGDAVAVDDVSLTVADGEFLVIAGANGSGKTTLVRQFAGLLDPDAGTVRVNGTPVDEDPVAARTNVGTVFQSPRDQFVAATVGADVAFGPENLGLPREEIERRVSAALATVRMADRRDERIDALSGGERARVAVAGALAMEPDHLVCDEPLAGLDWPSRRAVRDRLGALAADGRSVVVVTHDLRDVAHLADRVLVLSEGRVVADGAPSALREDLVAAGVRPA